MVVAIMSGRQAPFYGLIQQQHLRAAFGHLKGIPGEITETLRHLSQPDTCHVPGSGAERLRLETASSLLRCLQRQTSRVGQTEEAQPRSQLFSGADTITQMEREAPCQGFCADLFVKFTTFQPAGVYSRGNTAKADAIKAPITAQALLLFME